MSKSFAPQQVEPSSVTHFSLLVEIREDITGLFCLTFKTWNRLFLLKSYFIGKIKYCICICICPMYVVSSSRVCEAHGSSQAAPAWHLRGLLGWFEVVGIGGFQPSLLFPNHHLAKDWQQCRLMAGEQGSAMVGSTGRLCWPLTGLCTKLGSSQ